MAATGTLNIPTPKAPYQTQNAVAEKATAEGYDPSAFTVDRNQTVVGQLEDLIDSDSAYIKQAERRSEQAMNDRGLLNSSIAVGAGRTAAIEAALPIASTDAGTFNTAMTNTVNAQNAAKHFTAGSKNTASLQNAQVGTQVSMANASEANKAQADAYQADTQLKLAGLDAQTRTTLAHIDGQYRQLLQADQSASSMFNQVAGNIATIMQSQTLDETGKNNAVTSQINMLNEALRTMDGLKSSNPGAVDSLNLGQYFTNLNLDTRGGVTAQSFDTSRYLRENPDVAQAVAAGTIPSAWFHYEHYGKNEGRQAHRRDGA